MYPIIRALPSHSDAHYLLTRSVTTKTGLPVPEAVFLNNGSERQLDRFSSNEKIYTAVTVQLFLVADVFQGSVGHDHIER